MDGILIINKPAGWTSFDVVAKVRGILKAKLPPDKLQRSLKVGHTGTLDPKATGVLVLCIGSATKSADKIMKTDKEYIGTITFGATSNTDDADGVITPCHFERSREIPCLQSNSQGISPLAVLGRNDIERTLKTFIGTFDQIPPQHSAKKVKGRRAYALARAGKTVDLKPVSVTVHEIEIMDYSWPALKVRAVCSKGFYMRSLARDLGQKLGYGGYLSGLVRTRVGKYTLNQSIRIDEVCADRIIAL